MTREEFMNKLQECYFGNKTAFNEIVEYVDELKCIAVEHRIMKKFICENDLWEKFLNYDDFINWLKLDDNYDVLEKSKTVNKDNVYKILKKSIKNMCEEKTLETIGRDFKGNAIVLERTDK